MSTEQSPAEQVERIEELLLGGPPSLDQAESAERAGVPLETARALWHSLGFAVADEDDEIFTEADAEALRRAAGLIDAGILDQDSQNALVRTWGRSFARLADWQVGLLAGVAAASDDPAQRIQELALDVIPEVDALQSYVWRRHLLNAANRLLMRPAEDADQLAVGFVDIVGYTSRSRNLDERELVELVEHFEEVATSTATDHGGRIVKTIGDEVLFVADDPVEAAGIALELVVRHDDDEEFPDVRAGLAHGAVVSRLGDVFGPTVNIASRLTSLARPGAVLVDQGMHDALGEADGAETLSMHRMRRAAVKGYRHLGAWRLRARSSERSS